MVKNKSSKQRRGGQNPQKKNYKHSRKSFIKNKGKPKEGDERENYKFVRKMRTIQRNAENEDIQKKRQQIEARSIKRQEELEQHDSSGEEEEDDYYDKVLSMLKVSRNVSKAIETSSDEDESDNGSEGEKSIPDNEDATVEESVEESEESSDPEEENVKPKLGEILKNSTKEPTEDDNDSIDEDDEDNDDSEDEGMVEAPNSSDPYSRHLDYDMSPELYKIVSKEGDYEEICEQKVLSWTSLGRLVVSIPKSNESSQCEPVAKKKKLLLLEDEEKYAEEGNFPEKISPKDVNLDELHLKIRLQKHAMILNSKILGSTETFTSFQGEIFSIINNYQDLYLPKRTFENCEELRFTYCLHAMNHVLKSYTKVTQHNAKIGKENTQKLDECRDQGLVRPKVLIILPFKNSAYLTINMLIELLAPELAGKVINHKRYVDEFTGEQLEFPRKNPKPEDYEKIFSGNTDDNFRIGISVTKKCLKLYSEFYSADIIVASPLGLRMIIGAAGDEKRDFDFLSSIEMLIIDQMDVILTQNWLHLLHIFEHLHLNLQTRKNTDFSRVRSWCLNGWSRFYRQTLLFSNHDLPEFVSLLSRQCRNYRGNVRIANPITVGTAQQISVTMQQVFHRIEVKSLEVSSDMRFEYFVQTILPRFKAPFMAHCLIYVPNYFDFVRIRNYFKKESMSFVQICEYTEDGKIARARDMFFHSGAHFLLYTERAHFYRRTRIKGIRHIIMYQPPSWPHFYPELINLMQAAYQNPRDGLEAHSSVTVLYTKYDALQAAAILGTERTSDMLKSSKLTHTILKEK